MSRKKKIVLYVRLSEEDIDKSAKYSSSIYNQLSMMRDYAKRMGLEIDKEYIDDGYSGINFERPGFEKLKRDIDNGEIEVIITKDMSRLGRNFLETAYYISEYFPKNSIRYIAINDEFDSDDPDSSERDIMVGIRSIINDRYVKDTSIKRKQNAEDKTKAGEFIGFLAPYGYEILKTPEKRTLKIDDYAAGIVKRIFTEIASGKTRVEVAEGLNNDKILPPVIYMNMTPSKNKKYYNDWSDKIIYRILKNKTYTGRLVVRTSTKDDYKHKKRTFIPVRDRKTKDNTHPVIITDKLFDDANSKLKIIKKHEKNNYDGTFTGLVVCGVCGNTMTACRTQKSNGNIKYYFSCNRVVNRKKCSNRVLYDSKLSSIIQVTLKELIDDFVDEKEIIDITTQNLLKKERFSLKISNMKQDIELHNINIRNLYMEKSKGNMSLDDFVETKKRETLLKEQKEIELQEILVQSTSETKKTEIINQYNHFINKDIFLKDYIRDVIEKIIVHKDNTIQIAFKFGISKMKTIRLY